MPRRLIVKTGIPLIENMANKGIVQFVRPQKKDGYKRNGVKLILSRVKAGTRCRQLLGF